MFEVRDLCAWYGEAQALRDVSFEVRPGELVTLVGRNGAGKTTALHAIMGLHTQVSGQILLDGMNLSGWPSHRRAQAGLGYVPDDRGIYASLTVEENLLLPPAVGTDAWSLDLGDGIKDVGVHANPDDIAHSSRGLSPGLREVSHVVQIHRAHEG